MKLGQVIIGPNLVLSTGTLIWPQNTIFVHIYLYLPTFTYIWLNVAIIW